MKRSFSLSALFVLASLVPASANIITYTYTGTLSTVTATGLPLVNVFGSPSVGQAATLVITDDTSKGTIGLVGPAITNIGGYLNGLPNPVSYSLTANGITYSGAGYPRDFGIARAGVGFVTEEFQSDSANTPVINSITQANRIYAYTLSPGIPLTLDQNFDVVPSDAMFNFFETLTRCVSVSAGACSGTQQAGQLALSFTATRVTAVTSSAVPEPFTLSVFAAGLAGIALRRRKKAA